MKREVVVEEWLSRAEETSVELRVEGWKEYRWTGSSLEDAATSDIYTY